MLPELFFLGVGVGRACRLGDETGEGCGDGDGDISGEGLALGLATAAASGTVWPDRTATNTSVSAKSTATAAPIKINCLLDPFAKGTDIREKEWLPAGAD